MRIVVKIGGSLAVDDAKLADFVAAAAKLPALGLDFALVHGGGREINRNVALLDEKPTFIEGLRVTTPGIMKMVEMTLSGSVNKRLVRLFLENGCPAAGISGVDGELMSVVKRGGNYDLGLVGEVQKVNTKLVETLWAGGFVPVVSPISYGDGLSWNVNADTAAAELASALKADKFLLVSDVPGVLKAGEVLPELGEEEAERLIACGVISDGMIPKVRESFRSIRKGIREIHIVGWSGREQFEEQVKGVKNAGTILR